MANDNNAPAFAQLDAFLERLRSIPNLAKEAAPAVAEAYQDKIEENISREVDPYGQSWPPRVSGEGPLLVNAAQKISTRALESTIVTTLDDPILVMHHVGSARGYRGGSARLGGKRRPLIPWKGLPGPLKAVTREVLSRHFQTHMSGEGSKK